MNPVENPAKEQLNPKLTSNKVLPQIKGGVTEGEGVKNGQGSLHKETEKRRNRENEEGSKIQKFKKLVQEMVEIKHREGESSKFNLSKAKLMNLVSKNTFQEVDSIIHHSGFITSIWVNNTQTLMITSSFEEPAVIWTKNHPKEKFSIFQKIENEGSNPRKIAISQDELTLVTAMEQSEIVVWARKTKNQKFSKIQQFDIFYQSVSSLTLTPNGNAFMICIMEDEDKIMVYRRKSENGDFELSFDLEDVDDENGVAAESAAMSEDQSLIVFSARNEKFKIFVFDEMTQNYSKTQEIREIKDTVFCLALGKDKKVVMVGTTRNCVILAVNPKSGDFEIFQKMNQHQGMVCDIKLSSDSNTFVSVTSDCVVYLWSRNQSDEFFAFRQAIEGHRFRITSLFISDSTNSIISGDLEGNIKFWSRKTQKSEFLKNGESSYRVTSESEKKVKTIIISKDQQFLVTIEQEEWPTVFKIQRKENGQKRFERFAELTERSTQSAAGAISHNGGVIVYSGDDSDEASHLIVMRLSSNGAGYELAQKVRLNIMPLSLAISADFWTIAVGSYSDFIWILVKEEGDESDKVSYKNAYELKGHNGWARGVAMSDDSEILISGSTDKRVVVWKKKARETKEGDKNEQKYQIEQELEHHSDEVTCVELSTDKQTLVSGSDDKTVLIYKQNPSTSGFVLHQRIDFYEKKVISLQLSKDSKTLAVASEGDEVQLWFQDLNKFKPSHTYGQLSAKPALALSQSYLALGLENGGIEVVPIDTEISFSRFLNHFNSSALLLQALKEKTIKEAIEYLLGNLESASDKNGLHESLRDPRRAVVLHSSLNPLFWASAFQYPDLLTDSLKTYDYEYWAYRQNNPDFDPFLISLKAQNQEILDTWITYFTKKPEKLIIQDKKILYAILASANPQIQALGIERLITEPSLATGTDKIQKYTISADKRFEFVGSEDWRISAKINKQFRDQEDQSKPGEEVEVKSTAIGIPLDLPSNLRLIEAAQAMTSENMLQLRPLILALYSKNQAYFLIHSFLNIIAIFLLFVIVVFRENHWAILAAFYTIFVIMLIYDLTDIARKGHNYFRSVYNWFDLILYPAGIVLASYLTRNDYDFLKKQFQNLVIILLLNIALTRVVSMLRVFDSMRYLILMILRVYLDMTPFIIVLTVYILGTGCILMIVNITQNEEQVFTLKEFQVSSDIIYNWGFGNWEDTASMNAVIFIFYLHTGVFIGLVMYNLLIAIISGTYEQFTEERQLVDVKEILDMISAMASFLDFFERFCKCFMRRGRGRGKEENFFHFLIPVTRGEDLGELVGRIGDLEGQILKNQRKIEEQVSGIEVRQLERDRRFESRLDGLEQRIMQKLEELAKAGRVDETEQL